jgi:lipopolysaccharide biosynthesis glycosyltransferase
LLRGDRLQTLQNLAKHNVQRPERSAWNRGTFLKWSIFEPQETPRSVFMDVDMLALGGLEEGIRKHAVGDFSCVPQFQASLRTTGSGPKSETEVAQGLQQLLSGEFSGGHRSRVNSGLLVLSKNLCSNDFWDRIVGYAEARVDLSEQSFFSNYFKAHDSSYLHMMPAKLNFQETYCRILSLDKQKAILQKVSLLHFAGPGKPWKVAAASDVSYGQALWLLYDFNRRRYFS